MSFCILARSQALVKELIQALKTELDEEDIEQGAPVEEADDGAANRILNSDRTPVHSDIPVGPKDSVTTEYGANKAINKHMNRQLFGALQKGKARRNRKMAL